MLGFDEELRVASFIDCLRDDINKEREETDLTPRALLWLAEKLKEVNDEFKKFHEEVYKTVDKEWAAHWERNKEEDNA